MSTRIIHLINPKTDSLTTRPVYMNRALYSPLAGLLTVAASLPRDQYEVVLTTIVRFSTKPSTSTLALNTMPVPIRRLRPIRVRLPGTR
jgi:hypothetical protein